MASVTGSRLAFFAHGVNPSKINIGLTTDGSNVPAPSTVRGAFNIEVFTSTPGALAAGYQASAFIPGAVAIDENEVQAGTLGPTAQLLDADYTLIDKTGNESIQIVGNAAGATVASSNTVIGAHGDTITGSTVAGNSQLIDASGKKPHAVAGAMSVIGGAGPTTVWGGAHDTIVGGAGALTVSESRAHPGLESIVGGAGSLTAYDLGKHDTISGSTGGTTFIDDSKGFSGGSQITGGSGNTTVLAGKGDNITGGAGATTVEGANLDTITGNTGALLVDITAKSSGAETVNLTAGHGVATLRDINPGNTTTGASDQTSVTGFATATDIIASKTSVNASNVFIGSSSSAGGNTTLTFLDGTTMILAGVTDPTKILFTQ